MAMYESEGSCPNNSFSSRGFKSKELLNASLESFKEGLVTIDELLEIYAERVIWERTRKLLGDRIGYMVYTKDSIVTDNPLVFDLFMESDLGYRLAVVIVEIIPECIYGKKGKKILLQDVCNPCYIPSESKMYDDDEYTVGIINEEEQLKLYIFKKLL